MATVLDEPASVKAATLTGDGELTFASFPITKVEETPDGDLLVFGTASDGTVDTDQQIVDPAWAQKGPGGFQDWYDSAGNVRVQHQAQRDPAGRGLKVEFHGGATLVKSLVVEPVAKELVRKRVLTAYSVGIANPVIERDPTGRAPGGIIKGGQIVELSLVDRPANKNCGIQLVKMGTAGALEFTGKVFGAHELLTKDGRGARSYKSVSVDLPKGMKIPFTPAQLAKMQTMARRNAVPSAIASEAGPELVAMTGIEPVVKEDLKDPDRDAMPASSFAYVDAQGGKHLPLQDEGHVRSALGRFAQQHFDSPAAKRKAAKKIVSRARGMGIDLGEHGTVVSAAGGKTVAADVPKAMKCAKCMDKGMADGKPCTECPKGAKKARRMMAKAVAGLDGAAEPAAAKKKKVMCATCGARQNVKHTHCPECGNPLHPGAIPVMKNHDFTCLGCGKTPLDKGEQHCPECGKENPGYLEVADRKLPMNAGKTAGEDRVPDLSVKAKAKKGKKKAGKKGKDGKKMPPWMKPDGDGGDGKDGAEKSAKPATVKRKKGKGNGRSPAAGAVSQSTEGLPAHREPDGAPVEAFEQDTRLTDGDHEMAASARHKSLRMDPDLAVLHDLTCPAFAPADVAKSLPAADFASVDTGYWQSKALEAASGADFLTAQREWNELATLCRHALTLKTADLQVLHDLRTEHHAAFLDANKAFRDATPGPGSFPTPGHVTPGQFSRPYISAGHAAASPQHDAPHSFGIPGEAPAGQDFHREYITAGHATDSPSNSTPRPMPQPAPAEAGKPSRVFYQNTMRDNARQALTAMHDHISRMFPDVCPMSPELSDVQKPAPAVPDPVGMAMPHRGKSAKAKTGKAAKMKQRKPARTSPALTALPLAEPAPLAGLTAAPDADVLKAAVTRATAKAVKAATAPLAKQLKTQAKVLDAIAGQRDTTGAPSRLSGLAKTATATSPAPAGPRTASESAEQAQTSKMRRLWDTWRTTSNPEFQEAAWLELQAMLGTQPMTGNDNGLIPMRRPFTT